MSTNKNISDVVEGQLPAFVRTEGPTLAKFIKAYYQWMEVSNNTIEVAKNLSEYQDIDDTYAKYFEYFEREILASIPSSVLVDKTLLAKHIKDLNKARGSEISYQLLFRILYDEEINFYYPGDDMLRVSDGRWTVEKSIRVGAPGMGDISDVTGLVITGATSGAVGRIERITDTFEAGRRVNELFLSSVAGSFTDGETVRNAANTITSTIINTVGPLSDVMITKGGAYHQLNDQISLSSDSGSGALGQVTTIDDTSAITFTVVDGGLGYRVDETEYFINGGSGVEASYQIASIANVSNIVLDIDTIGSMASVVIETGPTFVSLGANSTSVSANLASANVSSALNAALSFANTATGSIEALTVTNYGYGYTTVPTTYATDADVFTLGITDGAGGIKGNNAVITVSNAPGAISVVNLDTLGNAYNRYNIVTLTNSSRSGTQSAVGNPIISGVIEYPGRYTDTKGWLSWNNRLQDNYYYQDFSYEIGSNQVVNTYRKIVNRVLHPAGSMQFGRFTITDVVALPTLTITSNTVIS